MRAELSNQPLGRSCLRDALAELQACHDEFQTFVADMFDEIDGLAGELLGSPVTCNDALPEPQRESLQSQIDRLAALTAELAQSMASQRPAAQQSGGSGN
jgi:hypothetical protein